MVELIFFFITCSLLIFAAIFFLWGKELCIYGIILGALGIFCCTEGIGILTRKQDALYNIFPQKYVGFVVNPKGDVLCQSKIKNFKCEVVITSEEFKALSKKGNNSQFYIGTNGYKFSNRDLQKTLILK